MLFGKTIVVTGVASGIGRRTAELAGQLGAEVIGVDVNAPDRPLGHFVAGDISTPDGVARVADAMPRQLDALCNVAGVSGRSGAAATLAVNFFGLRALSERLAPKIREGGCLVNVASIAGYGWRANLERARAIASTQGFPDPATIAGEFDVPDGACYPISKEILIVWTMMAAHLERFRSRGIRVNSVSPGPVETPILSQFRSVLGDEKVDSDIDRVGRAGTAADIAPTILFLCSDGARWINGANIANDGGLEASINAEVLGF
ncbi:MAG: 3-alpha-hydroxysteroid dehydrogenase [Ahrensia sp.]|nr:3-alpha-hydroxysteroid dehydrogenase [Ahrensia sp.]